MHRLPPALHWPHQPSSPDPPHPPAHLSPLPPISPVISVQDTGPFPLIPCQIACCPSTLLFQPVVLPGWPTVGPLDLCLTASFGYVSLFWLCPASEDKYRWTFTGTCLSLSPASGFRSGYLEPLLLFILLLSEWDRCSVCRLILVALL